MQRGKVRIESEVQSTTTSTGIELVTLVLSEGSFFGEPEQLPCGGIGRRKESARAVMLCHLFMLNSAEFLHALRDFPEYKDLMKVRLALSSSYLYLHK